MIEMLDLADKDFNYDQCTQGKRENKKMKKYQIIIDT